jgi:hypothetical protein
MFVFIYIEAFVDSTFGISGFLRGLSASFCIISTILFTGVMTIYSISFENTRDAIVRTTHVNKVVKSCMLASAYFSYLNWNLA